MFRLVLVSYQTYFQKKDPDSICGGGRPRGREAAPEAKVPVVRAYPRTTGPRHHPRRGPRLKGTHRTRVAALPAGLRQDAHPTTPGRVSQLPTPL